MVTAMFEIQLLRMRRDVDCHSSCQGSKVSRTIRDTIVIVEVLDNAQRDP